MREREIIYVRNVEDTDWSGDERCMAAGERLGDAYCHGDADKVVKLKYDDEPDKRFYSLFCDEHASAYTKKWDSVRIFGEEDRNPFRVK